MQKIVRTSTIPLSLDVFCRGLLRELSQEYEVIALSSPAAELERIAEREGVRTEALSMRRRIAPLHDAVSLWRMVRFLRRERPQMIHSITPKAGLLSMVAGRLTGVPVRVHTFTGLVFPTMSGLRRRLLMLADRITCRCATHIIAEGEGVRSDLLRYGITRKEVRVLGYGNVRGVDMEYYDRTPEVVERARELRTKIGASQSTFVFVYAGRIVRDKGIDELVAAFGRLASEGRDVRLLLAGDTEADDPVSERSIRAFADNGRILVAGWQSDVRPFYAAADALVFPSRREGFPNVVLEAGAMGLPSIVTDINGSREIVRDGENGVVVAVDDAEALLRAMRLMTDDRALARSMGAKARPLIAERYEQSFVRAKLKEFYGSVL